MAESVSSADFIPDRFTRNITWVPIRPICLNDRSVRASDQAPSEPGTNPDLPRVLLGPGFRSDPNFCYILRYFQHVVNLPEVVHNFFPCVGM